MECVIGLVDRSHFGDSNAHSDFVETGRLLATVLDAGRVTIDLTQD